MFQFPKNIMKRYNIYVNELFKKWLELTYLKFEAEWACAWSIVSSVWKQNTNSQSEQLNK